FGPRSSGDNLCTTRGPAQSSHQDRRSSPTPHTFTVPHVDRIGGRSSTGTMRLTAFTFFAAVCHLFHEQEASACAQVRWSDSLRIASETVLVSSKNLVTACKNLVTA